MPEPDAFDPTHALDGWCPPAPAPLQDLHLGALWQPGAPARVETDIQRVGVEPGGFDPIHLLDGWRPPAPAPLDLEFGSLARAGRTAPDEAKRAWLKARGYEMLDVEDVELPDRASPQMVVAAADVPGLTPGHLDEGEPRLLAHYQPGAWTAVARRLRGASVEVVQTPTGPQVENCAPQWLCALWQPQPVGAPLLGRWPELAALVPAETAFGALHQLLAELPPEARLWPAEVEVDWALVAELVLHRDVGPSPAQARALRELIEAEGRARAARVNDAYARRGQLARRRA